MRLYFVAVFMTLVGLPLFAAPEIILHPPGVDTGETLLSPNQPLIELEPVQTTAPPDDFQRHRRALVSDSSTNFTFGAFSGNLKKDFDPETMISGGLQKSWYTLDETAYEVGLSLFDNKVLALDAGFKKLCCFSFSGSPYYKLGIAGHYNARAQLGNLIDYQKYYLQTSAGFENLFSTRHRLRFEIGGALGAPGTYFFTQFVLAVPD